MQLLHDSRRRNPLFVCLFLTPIALAGCSNHQPITSRADGSYIVSTHGDYILDVEQVRSANLQEAENYAKEKKLDLRIIQDDLETTSRGSRKRGHKLIFRLVDPNHEKIKNRTCFDDIQKNHALSILTDKMALAGAREQTFRMYANKDFPSAREKEAIALFGDLRKICYDMGEKAGRSSGVPEPILNLDYGAASVGDQLLVTLHNGEITFGEFARQRKKIADIKHEGLQKIEYELHRIGAGSLLRATEIAKTATMEMEKVLEKREELTHSERVFKEIDPGNLDEDDF